MKGNKQEKKWSGTRIFLEEEAEYQEIAPPTLQKLFSNSSVAKLLDFLTLYRRFDYSLTEISRNSGVPWRTLHRVWPVLEKYDLVKLTRQIGRAKLYTLNADSDITKMLTRLSLEIASLDQRKISSRGDTNTKVLSREEALREAENVLGSKW
jgi:DNA-binding transcriptional ArsR family regulator